MDGSIGPVVPADSHVHSEWSWDAPGGSMEATCARAVRLGLPAVAFTDHVDHTRWELFEPEREENRFLAGFADADGTLTPPPLDVAGYLAEVRRCRDLFPDLAIITGVELGEPHWYPELTAELLADGDFDRVLGSQHSLPLGDRHSEMPLLFERRSAPVVMRDYLDELEILISSAVPFSVLAHIDYPLRAWPAAAGAFDVYAFEEQLRHVLGLLAGTGRGLEINTRLPLDSVILGWWVESGGDHVTFGSDAHDPTRLAQGFATAAATAESYGFRPGRHPYDVWYR